MFFLNEPCVYNSGNNTLFPYEFCTEPKAYFCGSSHISRGECFIVEYYDEIEERFSHFTDKYVGGFEAADYCPVSYIYYKKILKNHIIIIIIVNMDIIHLKNYEKLLEKILYVFKVHYYLQALLMI